SHTRRNVYDGSPGGTGTLPMSSATVRSAFPDAHATQVPCVRRRMGSSAETSPPAGNRTSIPLGLCTCSYGSRLESSMSGRSSAAGNFDCIWTSTTARAMPALLSSAANSATLFSRLLAPRHFCDTLYTPNCAQRLAEMWKILDLDLDHAEHARILAAKLEAADIGLGLADGGCDVRVQTATVRCLDGEPHQEPFALHLLPVDFEPALRLVIQQHEIGTVSAVNAHAASARYVARDRITGHRLTALRVPNEQTVGALDSDTAAGPTNAIDQSLQSIRARRLELGIDFGVQAPNHVATAQLALPNGADEVAAIVELERFRRRVELVIGGPK